MAVKKDITSLRYVAIYKILMEHKGVENGISAEEFRRILKERGFDVKKEAFRTLLSNFRKEFQFPVCYKRFKGYFCPASIDDILTTINDLEKQKQSLEEHIEFMKKFAKM